MEQQGVEMERWTAHEIVSWAVQEFGPQIAMSSSFQSQSLPLLHIVSKVAPQLPIIFLDTGYHFPETLAFRDRLIREWGLTVRVVQARMGRGAFVEQYGNTLYQRDPDLCCYINKVEPMQQAMEGLNAWISGIRRDQSASRADIQVVEKNAQGIVRIHPLANWTEKDVWQYIHEHQLPDHPLMAQGYLSVGCAPCTAPIWADSDARSGRWASHQKTECGLHTILRNRDGRGASE